MLLCPGALAMIHHLLMRNPLVFLFDTDWLGKPMLAEMAQEGIRGGDYWTERMEISLIYHLGHGNS